MIAAPAQQTAPAESPVVTKPESVPRHIAIIMDGNGRWAKARGLPRTEGHRQGTENLRRIIKACVEFGVEILTIYAFSTENWRRPPLEVRMLMTILERVIDNELEELGENGVQIRHIGKPDQIAPVLLKKIKYACELTKDNRRLILNVAFNYGGRDEIVQAVRRIIQDGIPAEQVTEGLLTSYMYTGDLPDPDLIVRTSGELRVSNFLIWQGAYSELYVTPVYWPDFDKGELRKAIDEYNHRTRRFGKTDEQLDGES
jgi:undecaprenyl diphosphate synthase